MPHREPLALGTLELPLQADLEDRRQVFLLGGVFRRVRAHALQAAPEEVAAICRKRSKAHLEKEQPNVKTIGVFNVDERGLIGVIYNDRIEVVKTLSLRRSTIA